MKTLHLKSTVPLELEGLRLDQAIAKLFPDYSRSQLQHWIKAGQVAVNGKNTLKARDKVTRDQLVEINAHLHSDDQWLAQPIPLNIIYEDASILILNKPASLTVHPGAGNYDNTLVNALLHYDSNLAIVPRAGLIHRLDKDTSGILVVAKTLPAHNYLVHALQKRDIKRTYQAIVDGVLVAGGQINAPIGRHPTQRTKMDVTESGRPAITHYRVIKRFRKHTHIRVELETGRTHQIRVHLAHIGYPIVGDRTYNRQHPILGERAFPRQALHAFELEFVHPDTQALMKWQAPLPDDMIELLQFLEEDLNVKH